MLAVNANAGSHQIEQYNNLSLVVILHCLNSFQHYNYVAFSLFICFILRENRNINVVCFPSFENGCSPACEVWRRLRMGEYVPTYPKLELHANLSHHQFSFCLINCLNCSSCNHIKANKIISSLNKTIFFIFFKYNFIFVYS